MIDSGDVNHISEWVAEPDVETKGFVITDKGDSSVGIFEQNWVIEGDFVFQSKEDFVEFKRLLAEAWELVAGEQVEVFCFEEEYIG